MVNSFVCISLFLLFGSLYSTYASGRSSGFVQVPVNSVIHALLHEEDTDHDTRITIDDLESDDDKWGDGKFILIDCQGARQPVQGTWHLHALLEQLILAGDKGDSIADISLYAILRNPVDKISQNIREMYWDALTRSIGEKHLSRVLSDSKSKTDTLYLYVPATDSLAYACYSNLIMREGEEIQVIQLPENLSPTFVRHLGRKHGLLSLNRQKAGGGIRPMPYVVPGGRFNEMYGWDSYFIVAGLLLDKRIDLAKAMAEHFIYQIIHYGKILNANRTYYLTRSQPPFLTSMALNIYARLPENENNKVWLKNILAACIQEYETVWMSPPRLTKTGLSRYYGEGIGEPPEVEQRHFNWIYKQFAEKFHLNPETLKRQYRTGRIDAPALDLFFTHDRAMRESGHDTTWRWDDRCADFVTVDLNCLLYKYEIDIARMLSRIFGGQIEICLHTETAEQWREKAKQRQALIQSMLWDEENGVFLDYDLKSSQRHDYIHAAVFYPFWACHADDPSTFLVTPNQAKRMVDHILPLLEQPGGIAASALKSRGLLSESRHQRQWDYPFGWAPHQMLIWQGLVNMGYSGIANRLIYKWLYMITRNAVDYAGTIPEKYDVVKCSHQVFAEYGNVGTEFEYITREGFGWMNASYQTGLSMLPESLKIALKELTPPDEIFIAE